MSKYGEAWKRYYKTISKLGAQEFFPNPDVSPDKTFITSGVWKKWYEPKVPRLKRKSRKKKEPFGAGLVRYARRTGAPKTEE